MVKKTTKSKKKSGLLGALSVYPDLTMAISMLNKRAENVDDDRRDVIKKWADQLEKVQSEINHLKKLEQFKDAVTRKET